MKQLLKLLGCLCTVVLVVSCKETEEQRIARHIKYWENKEILFPKDYAFTVYFLLDKENRVVAVGNPVHNLKIWELYMEMIKAQIGK